MTDKDANTGGISNYTYLYEDITEYKSLQPFVFLSSSLLKLPMQSPLCGLHRDLFIVQVDFVTSCHIRYSLYALYFSKLFLIHLDVEDKRNEPFISEHNKIKPSNLQQHYRKPFIPIFENENKTMLLLILFNRVARPS